VFRSLLLFVLFLVTLFAEDFTINDINNSNIRVIKEQPKQKVLYLSYKEEPKRVIKGEIFSVTLKIISTTNDFDDIEYQLSNYRGLKPLNDSVPIRGIESKYLYDTFYFLATSSNRVKLPDFTAKLITPYENNFKETTLLGKKIETISLNPKKDFANIIANNFEVSEYKTTSYDNNHNIVVFVATAQNSDIKKFHVNNVCKQGIESVNESIFNSKIIYYVIIDKNIETLSFSYFNLLKNKFITINIPIIVQDDSVTTQSDLKPRDQSKEQIKMAIAAIVALIAFIVILWRRKYIYLIFIIIPLIYIAYLSMPAKEVCIKKTSNIYLLPMKNGTIFETTQQTLHLQKEGSTKGFTKVKLQNNKIGWIKNEDICSY
jgi:hypothetical protein